MKKIYTFLMTAMVALTSVTVLTSCDQDVYDRQEARTLDGTWTGYIDTYYADRWGLTGDSYRTTLYFQRENPYGGWGYEVDYNLYSPRADYYYCEFRWEVYNGTIRIKYADSWSDVLIYKYFLDDNYFEGYMDDGTSKEIRFRLSYDSRFDWGVYRASAYRAPAGKRAASQDSTTVIAKGEFAR